MLALPRALRRPRRSLPGDVRGELCRPRVRRVGELVAMSDSCVHQAASSCPGTAIAFDQRDGARSGPRCRRYTACGVSPLASQPSRMASTQFHAASTSSRRTNRVGLPSHDVQQQPLVGDRGAGRRRPRRSSCRAARGAGACRPVEPGCLFISQQLDVFVRLQAHRQAVGQQRTVARRSKIECGTR